MIVKISKDEQKEDNHSINILAKEIESWKDFRYALREEDALLFNEMLSEYEQNKNYIWPLDPKANTIHLNHCLCY